MKSNLHDYNNRTIHVLFEPLPTPGFIQYPSNQLCGHRAINGRRSFVPRQINSDIITSQAATRWRPDNQWLQVAKKILTLRSEREGYCGGLCPPGGGELIPFMDRTQTIFTSFIKNLRYLVNGYMSFFYNNKSKMYKIIIKCGEKTWSANTSVIFIACFR